MNKGGGSLFSLGVGNGNIPFQPYKPPTSFGGSLGFTPPAGNNPLFVPKSQLNVGGLVKPTGINPTNAQNSQTNTGAASSSIDYNANPYYLRPRETQTQYNTRIATLNGSQNNGQTTGGTGSSQNNNQSQTFPGLVQKVSSMSSQPSPQYTAAYNAYQKDVANLNQSRLNEANTLAANAENPIPLEFQQGRAQVLQSQYQQQQDAYAQQAAADIAAATAATGQQTAQLGGAEAAAGVATPQVGAYGQTFYNPLTGQTTGGTAGVSSSDPFYATLQGYANDLANNQPGAVPSSISGNSVLWNQVLQMAKQINPNFNYNAAVGAGNAQTSNVQTGGTAATTANQGVYNNALSSLTNYQNMAANIKSFGTQLQSNMTTAGINPTASQWANKTLNDLQSQFSSAGYSVFNANIQGLQARVSDLLNTGEIPSSATAGAQAIVNGNITLGAMTATLNQINNEASAIVSNQQSIANKAFTNIQRGARAVTSGGGNTVTAGGISFTKNAQGEWVTQ